MQSDIPHPHPAPYPEPRYALRVHSRYWASAGRHRRAGLKRGTARAAKRGMLEWNGGASERCMRRWYCDGLQQLINSRSPHVEHIHRTQRTLTARGKSGERSAETAGDLPTPARARKRESEGKQCKRVALGHKPFWRADARPLGAALTSSSQGQWWRRQPGLGSPDVI